LHAWFCLFHDGKDAEAKADLMKAKDLGDEHAARMLNELYD